MRLYTTEEDEVNCESWKLLAGWVKFNQLPVAIKNVVVVDSLTAYC